MAAAVVSGGAALLLDAEADMSPAQVKVALQIGARFMPAAGLVAAGTGSVDFEASLPRRRTCSGSPVARASVTPAR
jgi:hypothetical protein